MKIWFYGLDYQYNVPNIGDQVWLITSRHTEPLLDG